MRVRNFQGLKDALYASVLASSAVQHVETGVGPRLFQDQGDVAANINLLNKVAATAQGLRAGCSGYE